MSENLTTVFIEAEPVRSLPWRRLGRQTILFGVVSAMMACKAEPVQLEIPGLPSAIHSAQAVMLSPARLLDAKGQVISEGADVRVRTEPPGILLVGVAGTTLTAIKNGTVTLIVEAADFDLELRHPIRVRLADRVAVSCGTPGCAYSVGDDIKLSVMAYSGGEKMSGSLDTRYTSSNEDVASVNEPGTLKAKGAGIAKVSVSVGEAMSDLKIYVSHPPDEIALDCPGQAVERHGGKSVCAVGHGEEIALTPHVYGKDHLVYKPNVTWTASDPEILTIRKDGSLFGRGTGVAKAIVSAGAVQAELEIHVVERLCTKRTWKDFRIRWRSDWHYYRCLAREPKSCVEGFLKKKMPFQDAIDNCCCESTSRKRRR